MKKSNLLIGKITTIFTLLFIATIAFAEDALFIDQNGNVGIGTSSPSARFVVSPDGSTENAVLSDTTGGNVAYHRLYRAATSLGKPIFTISNNNGEVFRVEGNGNVGIGTTDPNAKLEIKQNSGGANILFKSEDVLDGAIVGSIGAKEGSNYLGSIMFIDQLGVANGSEIRFRQRVNGSNTNVMSINNGNVGIGTTSPSYNLHVNGTAYATGAAGALSDGRHKMNIDSISANALDVVNNLRPVSFEWKKPVDDGMEGKQLGFIAQEVEKVLPEVVLTQNNEEHTKGLKYNALIPMLTKAIQELAAENRDLKTENRNLQEDIKQIKSLLGL